MNLVVYALGAGALATLNPCGFAMLPAILGRFLARGRSGFWGGLSLGLFLTLGTLSMFAVVGLLLDIAGTALEGMLPYVELLLSGAVLLIGALTLGGRFLMPEVGLRAPLPLKVREASISLV